jgi:hypothetical protein
MDEAAEEVVAFDRRGAWWIGSVDRFVRLKAACSMRASAVVVGRIGAEHVLEMSAADDPRRRSGWACSRRYGRDGFRAR